jgi:8-oxo-dGTP diphosphatase
MTLALTIFPRLPVWMRRLVIRTVAPTYVVGVVAVIGNPAGEVLLLRERHHDGWALPGGLTKRGEPPDDALVRELREEIGVSLSTLVLQPPTVNVDAASRRVDVVYEIAGLDQEPSARPPEVLETRWFATDQLPELFEPTLAVLRAARVLSPNDD